jgi:hypothetical protein
MNRHFFKVCLEFFIKKEDDIITDTGLYKNNVIVRWYGQEL